MASQNSTPNDILPQLRYLRVAKKTIGEKQLGKNNWLDIRIFGKLNIRTGAGHWRCQAGPVTDSLRSWDGPAQLGKLGGPPGTDSDAAGRLCAPKDKAALLPVPGPA